MTDKITPEHRSANMRAIRSKNMKPEMLVRTIVYGMGFRYRLHKKELPGKPDLSFPSKRKVIFVHGCFWHQHESRSGDAAAFKCKIARVPKSNIDYWKPKLERNKSRDKKHIRELKASGWKVLLVWECETKNSVVLEKKLRSFLTE